MPAPKGFSAVSSGHGQHDVPRVVTYYKGGSQHHHIVFDAEHAREIGRIADPYGDDATESGRRDFERRSRHPWLE